MDPLYEYVVTLPTGFVTTMFMSESYKETYFPTAVRVDESPFVEEPAPKRGRGRKASSEE